MNRLGIILEREQNAFATLRYAQSWKFKMYFRPIGDGRHVGLCMYSTTQSVNYQLLVTEVCLKMVLSKYSIYTYVLNSILPYFLIQTNNAYELFAIDIKLNKTEYFECIMRLTYITTLWRTNYTQNLVHK